MPQMHRGCYQTAIPPLPSLFLSFSPFSQVHWWAVAQGLNVIMSARSPPRSPSPSEPGMRSSATSSVIRSRISSTQSSRMRQRRTSVTSSARASDEEKAVDAIWLKTQEEWEALKRLAVRRKEQDAWMQLMSDERQERLALDPEHASRRSSVVTPARRRSIAHTSAESSTSRLGSSTTSRQVPSQPAVPEFVRCGRGLAHSISGEAGDSSFKRWRYWFRGIYTDAKAGVPRDGVDESSHPLEAKCCWYCSRRRVPTQLSQPLLDLNTEET